MSSADYFVLSFKAVSLCMASLRGLGGEKITYAIKIEVPGLLLAEIYSRKLTSTFVVIRPSKIL